MGIIPAGATARIMLKYQLSGTENFLDSMVSSLNHQLTGSSQPTQRQVLTGEGALAHKVLAVPLRPVRPGAVI